MSAPYSAWKSARYGRVRSFATTAAASALAISKFVVNGWVAWIASVAARPSRKKPPLGLPSASK